MKKIIIVVIIALLVLAAIFVARDRENSKQPEGVRHVTVPSSFNAAILALSGTDAAFGNGVVVDTSGIIMTAYHVVEGSTVFRATIAGKDYMAEIVPGGSSKKDDGALARIKHLIDNTARFTRQKFINVEGVKFDAVEFYEGPKEALYNQWVTIQGYRSAGSLKRIRGVVLDQEAMREKVRTEQEAERMGKFYDNENLAIFVFLPADSIVGLSGAAVLTGDNRLIGTASWVRQLAHDEVMTLSVVRITYIGNVLTKLNETAHSLARKH